MGCELRCLNLPGISRGTVGIVVHCEGLGQLPCLLGNGSSSEVGDQT